jgi:hypothetical protein
MYGTKYLDGFQPVCEAPTRLVHRYPLKASVTVAKGDCLKIVQGTGYAELGTTLAAAGTIFAIALEPYASQTSDGDEEVLAIPILANMLYKVPVTANAVLARATHVGYIYNLDGSEDGISVAAVPTTYYGFRIHDIDISTEAVAVNTYGYAIGSFEVLPEIT